MKIYKFWAKAAGSLRIEGKLAPASAWGGSNESVEEAQAAGLRKLETVQCRIDQRGRVDKAAYEAEIREEILDEINPRNVVTRNRYGARVLNSEDLMFIDIDHDPRGFWTWLLDRIRRHRRSRTEVLLEKVRAAARRPAYQDLGFRLYETRNGLRVIVTGRPFSALSEETRRLFDAFGADPLYAYLCRKQNCFRARLTPKPYRMRIKALKVPYPRTEAEQAALDAWLPGYEGASQRFSVCRFVETIGLAGDSAAVRYHDSATRANKGMKLA